jgi:capsular exopolysaccharide synthesis family protein
MSRIQDILAKAEREGTARRLQPTSGAITAPATVLTPHFDGATTLGTHAFTPARVHDDSAYDAMPVAAAPVISAPAALEPRTARPTLHPALVAAIAPHSEAAEQYRAIRTRLTLREELGPLRTIGVTSPANGEGKSVTAANLALTMAQETQRRVVLVDADLRDPSVHRLFAVDRGPGLAEVLTGEATLEDALIELPDLRLTLLPAGRVADYPAELLGSAVMRRLLDQLGDRFDRMLLDLPSALPVADVGSVAPHVDGMLMVVRAGVTQRPALDQALALFDEQKVIGVVLNEAHP